MVNVTYDNQITKNFLIATMVWGIVGMLVGVLIALQLADPMFNFGLEWLSYGRLRPLHTNAVIFAFAGNAIFMGIYYSTQRLLKVRMFSDKLTAIHFWGWQFIIVCAAVSLLMGWTTGKEYAELEWWIDILIAGIWVTFGINFFGTIAKRNEKHLYVALWFYIATIVTIAILHIVNSIELPVSFTKSYPIYAGVQDALVQWWYGHNAVGFFLTTPFLGLMYYFLPKAAKGPVYSYRLSIIHFWALVFLYIWTGPHHLQYTALPDWAQNLGMVFSIMLWAPSWGGMVNGLMTLRGAWDKLKTDPILKFMVAAVTFYGMATFEGPLLSIKSVNALSHYTDWTIGHTHSAVLGWNGFLAFGIIYWLAPRLWGKELFSQKLANIHFWVALIGIVGYMVSMWIAGVTQGLMWKEFDADGMLVYTQFLDTLTAIIPMYWVRMVSGLAYFLSMLIMVYNLVKTTKGGKVLDESVEVADPTWKTSTEKESSHYWHTVLERKPLFMALGVAVVILIGTVVELVPAFIIKSNVPTISSVKPYTPLELEGRDLYIREGCYNCHSQMIRPFRSEVARYGDYSKAGEFVYDHPFQWGSKRTGPDLHRIGGKMPSAWHYRHMVDPQTTSKGSNMPAYAWLAENKLDMSLTQAKIKAMITLGVPYSDAELAGAVELAKQQAITVSDELKAAGITDGPDTEMVALIAYLQRLGTDIK